MTLAAVEIVSKRSGRTQRLSPTSAAEAVNHEGQIPLSTLLPLSKDVQSEEGKHAKPSSPVSGIVTSACEPEESKEVDAQTSDITVIATNLHSSSPLQQQQQQQPTQSQGSTIPDLTLADLEPASLTHTEHRHDREGKEADRNGRGEEEEEEEDEPLILRRRYISPPLSPPPAFSPPSGTSRLGEHTTDYLTLSDLYDGVGEEGGQVNNDTHDEGEDKYDGDDPFGFASAERKVGKALASNILAWNEQTQQQRRRLQQRQQHDQDKGASGHDYKASGKQRLLDLLFDSPASTSSGPTTTSAAASSSSSSSPASMVSAARKTLLAKGSLQSPSSPSSSSSPLPSSVSPSAALRSPPTATSTAIESPTTMTTRRGMVGRGAKPSQPLHGGKTTTMAATTSQLATSWTPSSPGLDLDPLSDMDDEPATSPITEPLILTANSKGVAQAPGNEDEDEKEEGKQLLEDRSHSRRHQHQSQPPPVTAVEAGKPTTPNRKGVKRYLMSTQLEAMLPRPKRRQVTLTAEGRSGRGRKAKTIVITDESELSDKDELEEDSDEDDIEEQDQDESGDEEESVNARGRRGRSTRSGTIVRSKGKGASKSSSSKVTAKSRSKPKTSSATTTTTATPSSSTYGKVDKGKGKAKADSGGERAPSVVVTAKPKPSTTYQRRQRLVPKLTTEEQTEAMNELAERKAYFDEVDQFEFDVEYTR
ncbi:hypothetical protein BGZ73_006038 [Actinomortierella ambigua]|nr:hypothetical protein BGZ73_006038 [Actinomortierella ambigua]